MSLEETTLEPEEGMGQDLATQPVSADQKRETPSPEPATESDAAATEDVRYASLIFRDGLDMPIPGLELLVTLPSGQVCTAESTAQGAITLPLPAQLVGQATVEVKDATGKQQQVCSIDLAKCQGAVIIRSPKVKSTLPLRPHQQTPPAATQVAKVPKPPVAKPAAAKAAASTTPVPVDTSTTWWSANGAWHKAWAWLTSDHHLIGHVSAATPKTATAARTLSAAGQPLTVMAGAECPNRDNLVLGRNNVYRPAILDAAKRLGLIPQALCALMDCEAGKVTEHIPKLGPDGKQLKDKKGKPLTTPIRELWNAHAGNPQSGAAGLTQFLASTWLSHVLLPGFYIHDQCVANGWVRSEADAKGRPHWVFVLADGKTTVSPYAKRGSDDNVKKCLAMRMDPTWSINAAADYGNANLKVLERQGFKLAGLSDMDKAKVMYLMHHEGEGAGPLFIRNTLASGSGGVEGLRKKFAIQLGSNGQSKANEIIESYGGDVEYSYRKWLVGYIDIQFDGAGKYFCSAPALAATLSSLMNNIGGEKL